jgi:endoglucanase
MIAARSLLRSAAAVIAAISLAAPASASCFRGINLSGAEFGDRSGIYGQNYIYPSEKIITYFANKGMNAVRLQFLWERVQPSLNGKLDPEELGRLKDAVARIREAGMDVILDPHNYATYDNKQIGTKAVPIAAFADLWKRLAKEFSNRKGVSFGLMNEPHDIDANLWLASANAAITGIRTTGAKNLILVPGVNWTGAFSWFAGSADAMLKVEDPGNNYAYEVHQYLDSNFSGTHATCERADDAVKAIDAMTKWLKENHKRGFLGEFGAGSSVECLTGLAGMVDMINAEKDTWIGWTYWVSGDWWPATEPLNISPTASGDRIQLKALLRPGLFDKACGKL